MKEKLLLINSNPVRPLLPPVGLEYVAEHLSKKGYEIDFIEDMKDSSLAGKLENDNYKLILMTIRNFANSTFSREFYLPEIKGLVDLIKSKTSTPVVVGGSGFSGAPEEVLDYLNADFGVAGEGTRGMDILLKKLNNGGTPEKLIRVNDSAYLDEKFERKIINLKKYQENYGATIGVSTKNGCLENCIYCTSRQIAGPGLKLREPDKVVSEIESLAGQGINNIFFTDSVFNIPQTHAKSICDEIIKRDIKIKWHGFISPSPKYFSKELLELMKMSGAFAVEFSPESCSDKMLNSLGKSFRTKDIQKATELCKKNNARVHYSMLFGGPGESYDTVDETFRTMDKFRPDYVNINVGVRIWPHTELAKIAGKQGLIDEKSNLLKPIFYPVSKELIKHINTKISERIYCDKTDTAHYTG